MLDARVISAAAEAVIKAMKDGVAHGYTDEWMRQSVHVHRAHAADHLAADIQGDESEAHLEHALCRIAMAIVQRNDTRPR